MIQLRWEFVQSNTLFNAKNQINDERARNIVIELINNKIGPAHATSPIFLKSSIFATFLKISPTNFLY